MVSIRRDGDRRADDWIIIYGWSKSICVRAALGAIRRNVPRTTFALGEAQAQDRKLIELTEHRCKIGNTDHDVDTEQQTDRAKGDDESKIKVLDCRK